MQRIKKQKLHQNNTLDIPHDIIEKILVRLPVKSLLRFKAVSKTWEATISDPIFARSHLQQSMISGRRYIFTNENFQFHREYKRFKLVEIKNKEFQVDTELDYPSNFGEAHFMCYLDGLLLLKCYKKCSSGRIKLYALWNPSTRAFIMFGCPYSLFYDAMLYGFCYDPWIDDYKIVIGNETHYTVFNCGNKCWTAVKELPINGKSYGARPGVCFNGSLYWAFNKWSYNNGYLNSEIVRFDPRDDKFERVHKPEGIPNKYSLSLVLLGGHLCLYYNSRVQLFIMKKDDDQDSWTEFITIDMVPSINYLSRMPLFMTDEDEIIVFGGLREYFLAYDMKKRSCAKIKIHSSYINSVVFPFVESLMLGTEGHRRYRRQRAFEELREVFFLN